MEEIQRKPGQKYPTPTPGFADRVFYESLYIQLPGSHMAQEWCLAYGILSHDEAEKLHRTVCKRKGIKPTTISNSPIKEEQTILKKRKVRSKNNLQEDADL